MAWNAFLSGGGGAGGLGPPPLNYASGQSVGEAALGALGPLPPTTPPEDDSPLCVEHGLVHLIGGSGGEGHNRGASY